MATTQEILDHHLNAFFASDLQGVLEDYAEDVVFFTAEAPLKGVDEVRPLFEALMTEFKQPGSRFTLTQRFVEGPHGYIRWNAETPDNVYEMGTDTFVVRDGRIVAQSFTATVRPKR